MNASFTRVLYLMFTFSFAQGGEENLQPLEDMLLEEDPTVVEWRTVLRPLLVSKVAIDSVVALLVVKSEDIEAIAVQKLPRLSSDPFAVSPPDRVVIWRITKQKIVGVPLQINEHFLGLSARAWKLVNEARQGAQESKLALDENEQWLLACRPLDHDWIFSTAPLKVAVAFNPLPTDDIVGLRADLNRLIGVSK